MRAWLNSTCPTFPLPESRNIILLYVWGHISLPLLKVGSEMQIHFSSAAMQHSEVGLTEEK
jgi:hypothetical protein